MALTNALNSKTFNSILLESKPIEQFMTADRGVGQAIFSNVVKKKHYGRENLVPIYLSNSYEFQLISETYPNFQTGGGRTDKLMNVTPISQTSRVRFSGALMDRLMNASGSDYVLGKQAIIADFNKQIKNIMTRQFMHKKDGFLCWINGGNTSTTTQYLYGLNGAIIPANHLLWSTIDANKKYDIVLQSTGAVLATGVTLSSITRSTAGITVSEAVNTGATVAAYMLRPYSPSTVTAVTATQFAGRLDFLTSDAAYGVDESGSDLTSATDQNWRSEVKDFGGATLDEEVMEYLVSSCWGEKESLVCVADPLVIAKAFKSMSANKTFSKPMDSAVMGFTNLVYANGGREIPIVSSDWMRGSQQIDLINTDNLGFMGTMLEPKFLRPDFQLLEDTDDWINDIKITGNIYTNMRQAHARGTGLAKSSY